jgi:hypothetical protein
MIEQIIYITNTTPSVLLAWFILCAVAVIAFACQCLWLLVLQPLFAWMGNR